MVLRTRAESRASGSGEGLGAWASFYVPDGTPVRWVSDVSGSDGAGGDDSCVRLVVGAQDELVLDMSRSMVAVLVAALGSARLYVDLDLPANGGDNRNTASEL